MAAAVTVPWWQTPWVAAPILAAAAATGAGIAALTRDERPPGPPPCPNVGTDGGIVAGVEYAERLSGGAAPDETLPMLVLLHGRGMTGGEIADLAAALPVKARIIAPLGGYPSGAGFQWSDPELTVPIVEDAGAIANFLEVVPRCRPTVGKPVLAGYDEGAEVAYIIAADDPGLVTGVVGAAGAPHPELGLVRAPTVVLHGIKDDVLPYTDVEQVWKAMVAADAPVRVLRMFGVTHSFAGALQIKLWQETSRMLAAVR